ncbi:probetacellulin isoform X4 [Panthera pardus]|uniref:Probetacellulin isoform X4 n=1 Tax=Panthera pardus TaxID=9691 RepID=A0A9V1GIC8_PANPR|nr:probetacellulin isoform X4 [Panthera pardus]XP_040337101.1 probetacellulin isoform X3 [Puma yagouaroundi]
MDRAAPAGGASSLPLLLALALGLYSCHRVEYLPCARRYQGLVILHCVVADGNATRSPERDGLLCGDPGENCAATTMQSKRKGHFSRCPKQYKHYCIKGRCRFVVAEQTPSCVSSDSGLPF